MCDDGDSYDLYNGVPPHVADSDTSYSAARSVEDDASAIRARVADAIRRSDDGLTCDEVEVLLALRHQTASARIRELVLKHAVKDSGERRKTRSGRQAVIWVQHDGTPLPPKKKRCERCARLEAEVARLRSDLEHFRRRGPVRPRRSPDQLDLLGRS
jgi:hypothetical protein